MKNAHVIIVLMLITVIIGMHGIVVLYVYGADCATVKTVIQWIYSNERIIMGIYARFLYPQNGYMNDGSKALSAGLIVGERYEVEFISMGQSYTAIMLVGISGAFNSVLFKFEKEDGTDLNIYKDPRFNPYM